VLGLAHEAEENYILVQCSAAAVEQMLERTTTSGSGSTGLGDGDTALGFED